MLAKEDQLLIGGYKISNQPIFDVLLFITPDIARWVGGKVDPVY